MSSVRHEWQYTIEELPSIAQKLINAYDDLRIFCFEGNLGSGKTTLVKSICEYLGSVNIVSSPTFSLMNVYEHGNHKIYHFDLYRLNTLEEVLDLGIEEYIYSGEYCFFEWPEKITEILPPNLVVHCKLKYLSAKKRIIESCVK